LIAIATKESTSNSQLILDSFYIWKIDINDEDEFDDNNGT